MDICFQDLQNQNQYSTSGFHEDHRREICCLTSIHPCPRLSLDRLYCLLVISSSCDRPRDHIKLIMELTSLSVMWAITSLERSSLLLKVKLWDGRFQITSPKNTKRRQPFSPAIELKFILAHIRNWFYDQPLTPRARRYYCSTVHCPSLPIDWWIKQQSWSHHFLIRDLGEICNACVLPI